MNKSAEEPSVSSLAADKFVGSVRAVDIERALHESREVERQAQEYLLRRVKPDSRFRYR